MSSEELLSRVVTSPVLTYGRERSLTFALLFMVNTESNKRVAWPIRSMCEQRFAYNPRRELLWNYRSALGVATRDAC